jgi:hypothetical protein
MKYIEAALGIHTADAEQVSVQFSAGDLHLSYVDWQEQPRSATFQDVLGFRWQELDDADVPRDDTTFEVVDSPWLNQQAKLQAARAEDYAHYTLCFNACGVLDVLARRLPRVAG